MTKTPSNSWEYESDSSSVIRTPTSSVSTSTSHHNKPRTPPNSTQGVNLEEKPKLWICLGGLVLIAYWMGKKGHGFGAVLAMYILVGVPAFCIAIVDDRKVSKLPEASVADFRNYGEYVGLTTTNHAIGEERKARPSA